MPQILRLHRNENILDSREVAVKTLIAELSDDYHDGEFMTMRYYYNEGTELAPYMVIRTILGITASDPYRGTTYVTVFDNEAVEDNITNLRDEMNRLLQEEQNARKEADDEIMRVINEEVKVSIANEIQNRKDADDELLETINNEIKTAINKEIEDRTNADDDINERIDDLQKEVINDELVISRALTKLNEECGFDGEGEYINKANDKIIGNAHTLYDADVLLAKSLLQEIYDREDAIDDLNKQINNNINTKLNQEITDRQNADSFISGKVDTNTSNIATEITNRQTAITDLKNELLGQPSNDDAKTIASINDKINSAVSSLTDSITNVSDAAKSYRIESAVSANANIKEAFVLLDEDDKQCGPTINIYKDSSLESVRLSGQTLEFTYILANGNKDIVNVDVSAFLAESEFANGLQVVDHVVSVKRDTNSEAFLTVGADGIKLAGVQNAINTAVATATTNLTNVINNLDKTVSGKDADNRISVTISQVDGKLSGVTVTSNDIATKTALQNEVNRATSAETNLTNALNNTKLTSVTVNNITSQVANNKVSLTIDGGDILLDERYNPVSYPANPSNKFTAVAYSTGMTIDNALHRVDHNTSTLVQEVVNNESATSQALAKVRQGTGLNSDGLWSKPTSGPASNASSLADAVAKLSSYIATLEQKIANLESQIK